MGHGQKNILGKKRSKAGRSERDDSNKCKGIGENVEIYIRIYIYINIGNDIGCFMMFPKMALPPNHPF